MFRAARAGAKSSVGPKFQWLRTMRVGRPVVLGFYDADAVHIDAQQFRRAHLGSQVQRHIVAPAAVNVLHAVDFRGRRAGKQALDASI